MTVGLASAKMPGMGISRPVAHTSIWRILIGSGNKGRHWACFPSFSLFGVKKPDSIRTVTVDSVSTRKTAK